MERLANSKTKTVRNDHKRKIEVEAEVEHFQRLPDELVVQIFEKVSEAKWLCMCYLVSSRFASLVLQIETVSFKIPGWRLGKSLSPQPHSLVISMVDNFFKKFVSIKSLHVEVLCDERPEDCRYDQYLFKWKYIPYHKSVIFIAAKRDTTGVDNVDQSRVVASVKSAIEIYKNLVMKKDPDTRYRMLTTIIGAFPNLIEAVVKDSLNEGQIFVGEDGLDMMRRSVASKKKFREHTRVWFQPKLKLPFCGLVIEGVILVIFKDIELDDVSIAKNAFSEKELCEFVMEMLKQKPYNEFKEF